MEYAFEKLIVWQESRTLVKEIYVILKDFPRFEQYALCDQIRRAVISISSNIAEGNAKQSHKEKIHFFEIAFGSLMEVCCQIILANDLEYISPQKYEQIKIRIGKVNKLLSGLKSSLENK